MAWLCVSWRIAASQGEARQKLTCRRWLQVERGICLAAKTCFFFFLVFSFIFPVCPFFFFFKSLPLSLSLSDSLSSSCCCHPYLCLSFRYLRVLLNQFTRTNKGHVFVSVCVSLSLSLSICQSASFSLQSWTLTAQTSIHSHAVHAHTRSACRHSGKRLWMTACVLKEHVWQVMRMSLQQTEERITVLSVSKTHFKAREEQK